MGVFSDRITVSGSHMPTEVSESAGVWANSQAGNRSLLVGAGRDLVNVANQTGQPVTLNISHFSTGTTNPSGTEHADTTVTINPGDSADDVADRVMAAYRASGMNGDEATLATRAVIGSARAESARGHNEGQHVAMFVRVARAGGLAEYAAR